MTRRCGFMGGSLTRRLPGDAPRPDLGRGKTVADIGDVEYRVHLSPSHLNYICQTDTLATRRPLVDIRRLKILVFLGNYTVDIYFSRHPGVSSCSRADDEAGLATWRRARAGPRGANRWPDPERVLPADAPSRAEDCRWRPKSKGAIVCGGSLAFLHRLFNTRLHLR
jgi:hypothetical protein